jgi:hypothetical protein
VSELLLLEADLYSCIDGFTVFGHLKLDDNDKKGVHIAKSLFRDSTITFVSCFDSGTTFSLDPDSVFSQHDGSLEYFRQLKNLRDLWIAHRTGPQRYAAYGFAIHPDSGEVLGHGPFLGHYLYHPQDEYKQLVQIVGVALQYTQKLLSEKRIQLVCEVESLYSNQRLKLPFARYVAPDNSKHRMGRRKYNRVTGKAGEGKKEEG